METGFPEAAAANVFARQRRRQALSSIASRLRSEPDDVSVMLPFEEVVAALGRRGQRDLGVQSISLDSIVGTVDRRHGEFDRAFRPATPEVRGRWERIAAARRRGETMPPIEAYRIGELHFVEDGHHRVSVARALGDTEIEAHVREVQTKLGAGRGLTLRDLPVKRHERVFFERVPLPPAARARIQLSDEWRYAQLATFAEAWGFRASQARGRLLSRREMADGWFHEDFEPVVELVQEEDLGGPGTDAERYLRIAILRYMLLHTHDWTDEIVERLHEELRAPRTDDDPLVQRVLREMR